ncbi:MAG TPA: hypothetical protein VFW46_08095, partial [Stellaceae bacterium]|nr:hypothetical protein [Stellaceae bacterium]
MARPAGGANTDSTTDWRALARQALAVRTQQLLSRSDEWARPDLRAAFLRRIAGGHDPLGDQYSAAVSPEERRRIGATFTPASIVEAMLLWAKCRSADFAMPRRIVDPGAGTGRFSLLAAKIFPQSQVIAVESDKEIAGLLRANIQAAKLVDRVTVIESDFRSVILDRCDGPTL